MTDVKGVLAESLSTSLKFGKFYFPDLFPVDTHIHKQICEALDGKHKKILILCPRGFGKTTTLLFRYMARKILLKASRFMVYISYSNTIATRQTENLKNALMTNELIRKFYGSMKPEKIEGREETFSTEGWVANNYSFIIPRGIGQQVRSLNYSGYRPDLIICDDIEDKEELISEDMREKRREWFFSDPLKCTGFFDAEFKIVYIDTLKHQDAIPVYLMKLDDWHVIRFEAFGDDLKSKAPEYMSDERIQLEYETHKKMGMLDSFYREYRNIPMSTEDPVFSPKNFKYYEDTLTKIDVNGEKTDANKLINFVVIDPAKTVKVHSSDTAILTIGIESENSRVFVRNVMSGKFYPDEIYDLATKQAILYNATSIFYEATSLHTFITQPFENYLQTHGVMIQLRELKAVGKKEERIAQLAPYYRAGVIYHNKVNCEKLEQQLLTFPVSQLWDCMDAFGYLPVICKEMGITFIPTDNKYVGFADTINRTPQRLNYMPYLRGPSERNISKGACLSRYNS